jgi:hypothetical protein
MITDAQFLNYARFWFISNPQSGGFGPAMRRAKGEGEEV